MPDDKKAQNDLKKYRVKIDEIDDKIIELLNLRGETVLKIDKIKRDLKLDVFQPGREKEIISRMQLKSKILKTSNVKAIWKEIMGASKDIQGAIVKVGYLGPPGTFTHQAAMNFFPTAGTDFIPSKGIPEIFENIEKDNLEFGVIPIENSLQGTVRETLDYLIERNLIIFGEIELRINQNLIGLEGSSLEKIKTIYSHPQAIGQTRSWIKANLPLAKVEPTSSTSAAVMHIKELNDPSNAAIGTNTACQLYELKILSSNIEDIPDNFTRFLVISNKANEVKEGKVKTSIVYVTKHVPGALYLVLKLFADGGINLTKIESRPRRRGRWEYIFLMDFEGDSEDPKVKDVIEKMQENVIWYKILGTYPMI